MFILESQHTRPYNLRAQLQRASDRIRLPSPVFIMRDVSHILTARRVVSSSEAASLQGKPALTPIIAGSICGGLLIISWTIGFIVYFRKRYNRKQRKRLIAEGKAQPREKDLKMLQEKVVIPPDPAVLLGHRKPGEMLFPERQQASPGKSPWSHHNSRTLPSSDSKGSTSGTSSSNNSPRRSNEKEANSPGTEGVNTEITSTLVSCTTRTNTNPGDPTEPEVDIQVTDVMTIPSRV